MRTTLSEELYRDGHLTRRRLFQGLLGLTGVTRTLHAKPAFSVTEINHVYLNITDVKRSEEFYTKLFGPAEKSSSGLMNFRVGSADVVMGVGMSVSKRIAVDHMCLSVEGHRLESTAAKLKENGITPLTYADQLYFLDPDRILIQLDRPGYRNPELKRENTSRLVPQPLFKPVALDQVLLQIADGE